MDFIACQASAQRRQRARSPRVILFFGFGFLLVFSPVPAEIPTRALSQFPAHGPGCAACFFARSAAGKDSFLH
jgi:hypothetical protein